MSETFSPFVPSAGTGPDAAVGEPRIVELKNGQIEADGRIVTTDGYEETYLNGELIQSAVTGGERFVVVTEASALPMPMYVDRREGADDQDPPLAVSPLLPLGLDVIDSSTYLIYQATMAKTSSGGALVAYQKDSSSAGTDQLGPVYWVELDSRGEEVRRGSVNQFDYGTATRVSSYVTGDFMVVTSYGGGHWQTIIYHLNTFGMQIHDTRHVAATMDASSASFIEYAYETDTHICYTGPVGGGSGDRAQLECTKTGAIATTVGTLRDVGAAWIADGTGASSPANRRLPRLCYSGGVTEHLYVVNSTTDKFYVKIDNTTVFTSVDDPYIFSAWPVVNGIWPGIAGEVWLPGLRRISATVDEYTPIPWVNPASQDDTSSWYSEQPATMAEFYGPYLDLGSVGCITFGGATNGQVTSPSFHGSKGVWLIERDEAMAPTGIRLLGETNVLDNYGFVVLTDDNVLILLGKTTIASATKSIVVEKWKLITSDSDLSGETLHASGPSTIGTMITGGAPVEHDHGVPVTRVRWAPSVTLNAPSTGTAGSYLFCCHWCVLDSNGGYMNGPVSSVVSGSFMGGSLTVFSGPDMESAHRYLNNGDSGRVFMKVFGTLDAGTTFYKMATVPYASFVDGSYSFTASASSSQEILYTQGTAGALSGRLETSSVPPCRFFHCGQRRCVAGGLWRPNTIQFSDWYIYGEIVPWPIGEQWIVDLGSRVMGVGESNGAPVAFCKDGIFLIGGDGPDAMGEGGFDSVQKVSPIGCAAPGSVVECPLGWLYQGLDGQLYLLASGGNVSCVSLSARSLASGGTDVNYFSPGALVRHSVYDEANHRVIFVIGDPSTDGPTALKSVSLDIRNMQFSIETTGSAIPTAGTVVVDQPIVGPMWIDGGRLYCTTVDATDDSMLLVKQRIRGEAGWWLGHGDLAADTDQSLWRRLTFSTSNLTPWGKAGWGRVREVSFAVTQDSASETLDAPYSVLISARTDLDTLSSDVIDSTLRDSVVEFVPMHQKCSDLRLTVTDRSSAPLVWHGVNVSTTSAGRTRVR